jgi:hypothetical protein
MSLRDKIITEEKGDKKVSFIISDSEKYVDPQTIIKFEAHGPIHDNYAVTSHTFYDLGKTEVLDILGYPNEAVEYAYLMAKHYVESLLTGGMSYEDRTSFKKI